MCPQMLIRGNEVWSPLTPQVSWESSSSHHNNHQIHLHINTQRTFEKKTEARFPSLLLHITYCFLYYYHYCFHCVTSIFLPCKKWTQKYLNIFFPKLHALKSRITTLYILYSTSFAPIVLWRREQHFTLFMFCLDMVLLLAKTESHNNPDWSSLPRRHQNQENHYNYKHNNFVIILWHTFH